MRRFIFVVMMICLFSVFGGSAVLAAQVDDYKQAKQELLYAEKHPNSQRTDYLVIAKKFLKIYSGSPMSSLADDSLYYAAVTHLKSHKRFKYKDDRTKARKYLKLLAVNYNTWLAPKAYYILAEDYVDEKDYSSAKYYLSRLKKRFPDSEEAKSVTGKLADINKQVTKLPEIDLSEDGTDEDDVPEVKPVEHSKKTDPVETPKDSGKEFYEGDSGKVVLTEIKNFSAKDYTRIVIHTTGRASFEKHWLKENKKFNKPPRLFIDILNSAASAQIPRKIDIKDGLLTSIRWGYNRPGVTRVVLDSQNVKNFTVFRMSNPNRIVVDVSTHELQTAENKDNNTGNTNNTNLNFNRDVNTNTLAGAFGLKINTIVVDPGHGGKDPGATYYGLKEKDIVLDIAKEVYRLFKKEDKVKVYLTRKRDIFIPLEERTAYANSVKADVFVSIHVNASKNRRTYGIETFVLDVTNDKTALEVAAKENMATEKSMSDLQGILKDIMLNSKLEESRQLAYDTHGGITKSLYSASKNGNRGVKSAPFYVLVGAKMPSILIEAGFISNKSEAKNLKTLAYRKKVASAIHKGLATYIQRFNGN